MIGNWRTQKENISHCKTNLITYSCSWVSQNISKTTDFLAYLLLLTP